jgi:hypothetical protein
VAPPGRAPSAGDDDGDDDDDDRSVALAVPAATLTLGGMLEAAVRQRAQELGLEQEVLEPRGVHTHIVPLAGVLTTGRTLSSSVSYQ